VDDRMRASDADREAVTARLRDHYAEGRLTRDELDERIATALNAKTLGDLRPVLADLPEPRPLAPQRVPLATAPRLYPVRRRGPGLFPLVALALLTLVLVAGAGAGAVIVKVVLSLVALMFVFMTIAAIAIAAFVHRARRHWHSQWHWGHFDR
jgi:hypothetical protein